MRPVVGAPGDRRTRASVTGSAQARRANVRNARDGRAVDRSLRLARTVREHRAASFFTSFPISQSSRCADSQRSSLFPPLGLLRILGAWHRFRIGRPITPSMPTGQIERAPFSIGQGSPCALRLLGGQPSQKILVEPRRNSGVTARKSGDRVSHAGSQYLSRLGKR